MDQPLSKSQVEKKLSDITSSCKKNPKQAFKEYGEVVAGVFKQFGYVKPSELIPAIHKALSTSLKTKMAPGGGKQKGAGFEREVCTKLSNWLSEGEQDDIFWRSAMSGGRATVKMKAGVKLAAQSSDISPIQAIGEALTTRFSIECKFYASLGLEGYFFGAATGLGQFWAQVKNDAETFDKMPMLIAKQNRKDVLLILDSEGVAFFEGLYGRLPLKFISKVDGAHFLMFDDFLTFADPKALFIEQPSKSNGKQRKKISSK